MTSGAASSELEAFLQKPPPNWNSMSPQATSNPMAIAHAALEYLRESGDEGYLFIRFVLELAARQQQHFPETTAKLSNHDEELLFHCVTGCRQVSLWQYKSKYSSLFLRTLRDFMMIFGFEPTTRTHRTIQLACFTTSAALWKREWNALVELENKEPSFSIAYDNRSPTEQEETLIQGMMHLTTTSVENSSWGPLVISKMQFPDDLFQCMGKLIKSQSPKLLQAASLYMQTLLTEFVGRSAVSYRLPLEYHKQAHRSFEREGPLTTTTSLALVALGQVLTQLANEATLSQNTLTLALTVVQFTLECLWWEFGSSAWDIGKLGAVSVTSGRSTLRPPVEWRTVLQPIQIVEALVHVILKLQDNPSTSNTPLAQSLRQILLTMATLTGPIFQDSQERHHYASILLDGTLKLLQRVDTQHENAFLIDILQLFGRLVANFRLSILAEVASSLNPVVRAMASIGENLLRDQTLECERAGGDLEEMNLREWREEALSVILVDCAVMLASDPWLMYSGTESMRRQAQKHLASLMLGPLYRGMVECRTRMAALEERFHVSTEAQLDEAKEEISAYNLEEEMEAISAVGRLNLESALTCLAELHGQIMPRLQAIWGEAAHQPMVTAETSALLEEACLWTMYVSYLLTDDNQGEAPEIPLAVLEACQEELDIRKQQQQHSSSVTSSIVSVVQVLMQFAQAQTQRIAVNPSSQQLSPMLAKAFLHFFNAGRPPTYIRPSTETRTWAILLLKSGPNLNKHSKLCRFVLP